MMSQEYWSNEPRVLPWVPEVFSHPQRDAEPRDLTETGNRAGKVSGTKGTRGFHFTSNFKNALKLKSDLYKYCAVLLIFSLDFANWCRRVYK